MAQFRVKIVRNVKFLYKGKFYVYGDEFDFEGEPSTVASLQVIKPISGPTPAKAVEAKKVEEVKPEPTPKVDEDNSVILTNDGTEIIDTFEMGSMVSPAAIKAAIAKVEATPVKVIKEEIVEQKVEEVQFEKVETSRGWYDVINSSGEVISSKKLRKDEADSFITTLKG